MTASLQEIKDVQTRISELERRIQVEEALECVRARTMAMRHSNELAEVIAIVFEQLHSLAFEMDSCTIEIVREDTRDLQSWGSGAKHYAQSFDIPAGYWELDNPIVSRLNEALEKEETFYTDCYTREEKNRLFRWFFTLPAFEQVSEERKSYILETPAYAQSVALTQHGILFIRNYEGRPYSEDENAILRRFARVFEQTYTRFLDLKRAEEQAHRAEHQAALDRVRAEIASMRSAVDLQRITPIVWRELTTFGVPFLRSGVFIMNDESESIQSFLTTPEGQHLATLTLPYESSNTTRSALDHWRRGKVFTDEWDQQQFSDWWRSSLEQGHVEDAAQDQGFDGGPPELLYLHFVPFTQGMLYVGNDAPLAAEQVDLVKSLADTFSVAYARYEDFQQLEAQNEKLAATLEHLKSTQQQLIQHEKMASLGQLTAGIAHEIKNPLNFVKNFSSLAAELVDELAHYIRPAVQPTLSDTDEARPADSSKEGQTLESSAAEAEETLKTLRLSVEKIEEHGGRADRIVQSMMQHASAAKGKRTEVNLNAFVDEYVNLALHSRRLETRRVSDDKTSQTLHTSDTSGLIGENTLQPSNDTQTRRVSSENTLQPLHTIDTSGLIVERNYDERTGNVELVPQEIGQVLLNLLNNAFDAMLEQQARLEGEYRALLAISTERKDEIVEIRISDNGVGIPDHVRDKVFEPFFTTKPAGSGTGLGLSLSYDIVTLGHNGKLEMESEEDKGTTLVVVLPAK